MTTKALLEQITNKELDARFLDIYVDEALLDYQRNRYRKAIEQFEALYGAGELKIFSAPGRSEVGGNHTDHQHGKVLAASINLDSIAVVRETSDNTIRLFSEGYGETVLSLDDISMKEAEKETTISLIRGVAAGFVERGYQVGGFTAYVTSDVLGGAGLSSSAAFEILIGTIFSGLYNKMQVSAVDLAIIGQYAENVYFGKPSGLLDQMACSVGNLVYIDFANPKEPIVEKIDAKMAEHGYSLCITDTKGSHANLTDEYAAVPQEMKLVAKHFGQEVLRGISAEQLMKEIPTLREQYGDRCVLRAMHFIYENERVETEVNALKNGDFVGFLKSIQASGNSSYKYLQNIYANKDVQTQNVSIALAVSEATLQDKGVARVHGGGFAGTIQAFVQNDFVQTYQKQMDSVFGLGACKVLQIRKYGGIQVI